MTKMPDRPWEYLRADFKGPLPDGQMAFVVQDEHSRFPVVSITKSTSFEHVSFALEEIFTQYGIPKEIKTDNGAPFQGDQFHELATHFGFIHRRITPLHPKANGGSENFMKNIGKLVRNCSLNRLNFKSELYRFLRSYRDTPQGSTDVAPARAMFRYNARFSRLPSTFEDIEPDSFIQSL